MLEKILMWGGQYASAPLRFILGYLFLFQGANILFGINGTKGMNVATKLMSSWGLEPAIVWAFSFGFIKFVGAIFLILGIWTREAALFLAIITGLTIWKTFSFSPDLVANISFEYYLLIMGMCLAILLNGAGKLSVNKE